MFSPINGNLARLGLAAIAGGALMLGCGDASGTDSSSLWHSGGATANGGNTQDNAGPNGGASGDGPSNGAPPSGGPSSGGPSSGNPPSGSSDDAGTAADSSSSPGPTFDLALAATTLTGDLLDAKSTAITVTPLNGFTGTVSLTLTAPPEITPKLDKTSLTIDSSGAATANLTVASSKSGDVPFKVVATAGAVSVSKDITFTASKTLLITIPADAEMNKGTSANPRTDAFGPSAGIVVHAAIPLTLKFLNKDATSHIIHGPNQNGFSHGDTNNPIAQNAMDKLRTVTAAGNYNFYLHDQGAVTLGKLILQAN